MLCPRCRGTVIRQVGGDRFICDGQVVIDVAAPGAGGNLGPIAVPIYQACRQQFSRVEGEAALRATSDLAERFRQAKRAIDEAKLAPSSIHDDPETPRKIAQVAGELIRTRPADAAPIVVLVTIPGKHQYDERSGWAEVLRVWPVGEFKKFGKDTTETFEMGVGADGRCYEVDAKKPSVALTDRMQWRDPHEVSPRDMYWRFKVLERLEHDLASEPRPGSSIVSPPVLFGRPLTRSEAFEVEGLDRKLNQIKASFRITAGRVGTQDSPAFHGEPSKATRKEWRTLDRLQKQYDKTAQRRSKVAGTPYEHVSLAEVCGNDSL